MKSLYKISNISKVFKTNNVAALKEVSINVDYGDTLAVVGVSGSGKSTLLHIMGALDRPSEGTIMFNNMDLFYHSDDELSGIRNRDIGFVFQFHYLLPEFNAIENVMMPCLINGTDRKEAEHRASEILGRVGLTDRIYHKPGELSGGEQQRVAVARAVVLKPSVILADEPTGNLDLKTGLSIIELFFKLNIEDGITLVIVTHDKQIASRFNRIITLLDGRIVNEN